VKYYLIAGEASGDLHASHLIAALKAEDAQAEFRGFGGDLMAAQGMTLVRHYRDLAYMGIIPVLLHARTILRGMQQCKADIVAWQPHVLILVDYPGFNLKMAKFAHSIGICPVYYYIAPKLWAWKEYRIKALKRDVDELFSILPFEVDFFEKKHGYPIHYVGNPTMDEVEAWKMMNDELRMTNDEWRMKDSGELERNDDSSFVIRHSSFPQKPLIALLPGSRRQEIRDNLSRMLVAVEPYREHYRIVIAAAPGIEPDYYQSVLQSLPNWQEADAPAFQTDTYALLSCATAALVTSGTATLETALFRVPQVVCYYMRAGRLASLGRRLILKIPYISLVNLVAGTEVVPELVAEQMNVANLRRHLAAILPGGKQREAMLQGYEEVARRLGAPGAPKRAAQLMVRLLKERQ